MDSILIVFLVSLMINFTLPLPVGISQISKDATKNGLPISPAHEANELKDVPSFVEEVLFNKDHYYKDHNIIPHSPAKISMSSRSGPPKAPTTVRQAQSFSDCNLLPTVVYLAPPSGVMEPDITYFPQFGIVNRCGGCCSKNVTCQVARVKIVKFTIFEFRIVLQDDGKKKMEYLRTHERKIPEHLRCDCGCKVKPTDCFPTQRYHPESCSCVCAPSHLRSEENCEDRGGKKVWDATSCMCECAEEFIRDCPNGYHFDIDLCTCYRD